MPRLQQSPLLDQFNLWQVITKLCCNNFIHYSNFFTLHLFLLEVIGKFFLNRKITGVIIFEHLIKIVFYKLFQLCWTGSLPTHGHLSNHTSVSFKIASRETWWSTQIFTSNVFRLRPKKAFFELFRSVEILISEKNQLCWISLALPDN